MDNKRVPINVSVNPSEYSGRSIRLGDSDIREKMTQRMREFEDESRKWRDQFLSKSTMGPSLIDHRPRMFLNYPEFPELTSSFNSPIGSRLTNPSSSGFFSAPLAPFAQNTHKSFIEEDDNGNKKYKINFEIGDFKPNEIQVRTDGRLLIVKGDREIVAGGSSETKQFNREITLPDFVEPTSVTSFLSDGVLIIEAPVQLDRLGYSGGINSAITNSSSSIRQSPFRDTNSPSRVSRITNTNLQNSANQTTAASTSTQSSFNTPFFTNDLQPAPPSSLLNTAQTQTSTTTSTNNNINNNNNSQPSAIYKFNMSEFRPEDIAITVTDTSLKVHAVREESDYRGAGKTYREFKREIGLPHGADVKRLRNSLQPDGTLMIEIPVNDNETLRPPLSPTGISKKFDNFSLNEKEHQQLQQQQQQQQQTTSLINSGNPGGLIDTTNDGKDLRLTFDLTGYKPEDLSIKVIDGNTLKIHAVHIDNTRGNQIHREYTRQYQLPDWVQPELLRARMSDNGTLTVEIPVPQAQPSKFEQLINIQNQK